MENAEQRKRVEWLIKQWLYSTITASEMEELITWRNSSDTNNLFLSKLETDTMDDILKRFPPADHDWERHWEQVLRQSNQNVQTSNPATRKGYRWVYGIAIAALILGVVVFIWKGIPSQQTKTIVFLQDKSALTEAPHDQVDCSLRIGNDSLITWDSHKEKLISRQGPYSLFQQRNGLLIYQCIAGGKESMDTIQTNTITVPWGQRLQILLSDNTVLWLNEGSSIRFQVPFTGQQRIIELKGEAYFNVSTHRKNNYFVPFTVRIGEANVECTGTRFNINAYQRSSEIATSLFEGKVSFQINSRDGKIPLQQRTALLASKDGGNIKVITLMDTSINWNKEAIYFPDTRYDTVLQQMASRHGLQVIYTRPVPRHFNRHRITGTYDGCSISLPLMLEGLNGLWDNRFIFKVTDSTIVVTPLYK